MTRSGSGDLLDHLLDEQKDRLRYQNPDFATAAAESRWPTGLPLFCGLLFRRSLFRCLLFEKQLLLLSTLLRGGSQSIQHSLRFELSVSVRQVHQIIISHAGRSQQY
jgi:hypothetical protein